MWQGIQEELISPRVGRQHHLQVCQQWQSLCAIPPICAPEAFYKCLVIYIIFCMVCYEANNLSPQVHRGEFLWAIQIPSQWMKEAASILSYLSTHINTETVKTDKAMYMLCDCLCYQFANLPILGTLLRGIIFWATEMRILLCHMNHTLKYYHNLFELYDPFNVISLAHKWIGRWNHLLSNCSITGTVNPLICTYLAPAAPGNFQSCEVFTVALKFANPL